MEINIFDVSGDLMASAHMNGTRPSILDTPEQYEYVYDYKWEAPKARGVYHAVILAKKKHHIVDRKQIQIMVLR